MSGDDADVAGPDLHGGVGRAAAAVSAYVVGQPRGGDVVLVPGLCVSAYLRPLADALAAAGARAWVVDPPGWPYSGPPSHEPEQVRDLATAVAGWLVDRNLTEVLLVGQSVGGQVAAHVTVQLPDRVRALVLQGPTVDPAYRSTARLLVRFAATAPHEPASVAPSEVREWLRVGPGRIRRVLRLALADRLEETLTAVRCPVLVARGTRDRLCGREWAEHLAGVASGQLVELAGQPHTAASSDPAGLADLVLTLAETS